MLKRTRAKLGIILGLIAALSLNSCDFNPHTDAAKGLLDAFQGACSSQGQWTQTALAQTQALEALILSLQTDEKCKGLTTALTSVQSMEGEINRLATDPSVVAQKQAEDTKRELLLEYDTTPDGTLKDSLATELATADMNLASANAGAASTIDQQGNTSMVRGLNQLSGYVMAMLSDQSNLSACAKDHPNLAIQLGAGVLAIAGTFVNPAIGAAAAVAGQLLSATVDFARAHHLEYMLDQVRTAELAPALACGLQSLSDTYCQAEDMYSLIQLQADSYPAQWQPTHFWQGLDLLSRKIPGLLNWISEVANGAKPRDTSGADRQNQAWSAVHDLQNLERTVDGIIAMTENVLQKQTGASAEQTVRAALANLSSSMFGVGSHGGYNTTPIANYYSSPTALVYQLTGQPLNGCNPGNMMTGVQSNCPYDAQTIPLPQGKDGPFPVIATNAAQIFTDVFAQLKAQLDLVIVVDPSAVLREALQPAMVGQESPIQVMNDLVVFLDESAKYFGNIRSPESDQMIRLIRDTQNILNKTISAVLTAPGDPDGDLQVVEQLFDNLKLIDGDIFISDRLTRHIKWDLTARILHGDVPSDVEEILRASGRDAAEELSQSTTSSLDELNADINTAQSIAQRNVEGFVSLFHSGIKKSLKDLKAAADRAHEPMTGPHRPNRMLQAQICTLLFSLPEWPKQIDRKLCQGTVLDSVYAPLGELRFDDLYAQLDGQPLEKRMCTYQHFLRRSRLFETKPDPNQTPVPLPSPAP